MWWTGLMQCADCSYTYVSVVPFIVTGLTPTEIKVKLRDNLVNQKCPHCGNRSSNMVEEEDEE